ncbi:hypothetical protein ACP70R_019622 [Stipagrostis hirtigluma subsp. patula]
MSALVDLDLNCSPPSPEPTATEEPMRALLCQEQPLPDQGLHKVYGSFWKQTSGAPSSLHFTHEHKLMSLGERGSPNSHVSSNSNKRKTQSDVTEQNLDVRSAIQRKSDPGVWEKHAYHGVIDLEKPVASDDAAEIVAYSGFGYPANHIGISQDCSCCVSPENSSLAESGPVCRKPISSRVSPGSVGSSETPDCQSPMKTSNTESRYSLIDLNEPQEESLDAFCMSSQETYSPLLHSSSPYAGEFSKSSRQVFQKECGSSIGSLKESSITVIVPSSVADNSRNTTATSSVQRQGLIDLNMPLESVDMPSEVISTCQDKDANNDGSKGTVSYHFHSNIHSLQAETPWGYKFARNNNILASKDDNNVLLQISATNVINKAQSEVLIPETLVGNHVHQRLGASHDGESNPQNTVSKLQAEAGSVDKTVASAAETLLSIFSHYSVCFADRPGSSSQPATQDGNDEPQCSLDSFEKIVLNLEEIKDDGQSISVIPPDKDGPACGIKLKRGRGMRNFQREIIPGLVSLARQEICDDLQAIGYEPRKTRSRKTHRAQGASSTRSRARKRGSAARK